MAREEIPINPSLISWARKRSGFTLEEATEKFSHIEAWEAGSAFPTYPQLERLADGCQSPSSFSPSRPTFRRSESLSALCQTRNLTESRAVSATCLERPRLFSSISPSYPRAEPCAAPDNPRPRIRRQDFGRNYGGAGA
jgi:hypothetical protein